MGWPTDDLQTTDLDSGSDTPPRAMFLRLFQRVKAIIAARGQADGVCELNDGGLVPGARMGRGVPGGVASLGSGGVVPRAQIPTIGLRGEIVVYALPGAIPAGYLECDGSVLVIGGGYSELRTALGSTYALPTDPPDTVRLPNLRRRVIVGAGGPSTSVLGSVLGSAGGEETHKMTEEEMAPHDHVINTGNSGGGVVTRVNRNASGGGSSSDGPIQNAGGGVPFNVMQPSLVMRSLIRV